MRILPGKVVGNANVRLSAPFSLRIGGRMRQIPKIAVGDTLEMKKAHPCGAKRFQVLRIGSDIRLVCEGCGRDMVLPREKVEKALRKVISQASEPID